MKINTTMTQAERVKVKLNFVNAHIVNEIAKYIKVHTKSSFFVKTGFSESDLQKMINLKYKWTLSTVAIVSELVGFDILLIGNLENE